jgi:hypothetical protein
MSCVVNGCNSKRYGKKEHCQKHYYQLLRHGKIRHRTMRDPNKIIVEGNTARIVCYDKQCKEKKDIVIIDREDISKVSKYQWNVSSIGRVSGCDLKDSSKRVLLHNVIMGMKYLDHKDNNPRNNQKSNLRKCTHSQNMCNRRVQTNNQLGVKGIRFRNGQYQARITCQGKGICLGSFETLMQAIKAYNTAAKKYHGNFMKAAKIQNYTIK